MTELGDNTSLFCLAQSSFLPFTVILIVLTLPWDNGAIGNCQNLSSSLLYTGRRACTPGQLFPTSGRQHSPHTCPHVMLPILYVRTHVAQFWHSHAIHHPICTSHTILPMLSILTHPILTPIVYAEYISVYTTYPLSYMPFIQPTHHITHTYNIRPPHTLHYPYHTYKLRCLSHYLHSTPYIHTHIHTHVTHIIGLLYTHHRPVIFITCMPYYQYTSCTVIHHIYNIHKCHTSIYPTHRTVNTAYKSTYHTTHTHLPCMHIAHTTQPT